MSPQAETKAVADPERPVHIVFVGAGAVGCFYASRLHHPSHNIHVSLIARSNYKALAENGVHLQTHTFGDYTFRPHAVFPSVTAAAAHPSPSGTGPHEWDFIIVTTKALPDRSDDSALITPLVGPKSCIVLIQNGVGVEEPYRTRFPATPIISAVTALQSAATICATNLSNWWTTHGLIRDVELTDELGLQLVRWHKLCINAAFNPSSILSGGRGNADMVLDPELRIHLSGVMREIWEAAPRILGGRGFPGYMASPERILKSTERNTGSRPRS
ncbi:hypothetical protein N0V88_005476 [Collariella sp. IMI 366227]|nr:hypothetical protein N0V88_005476 [Collariella sp. IMI 366227]